MKRGILSVNRTEGDDDDIRQAACAAQALGHEPAEVASAIGVTRQTVGNWGLGQGSPALDKAAELARLYGVTLDDLANDEVDVVTFGKGGGVPATFMF